MGSSSSRGSSTTSGSRRPHRQLADIFFGTLTPERLPRLSPWLLRWLRSSASDSASSYVVVGKELREYARIARIREVHWCSSPFDELGGLRNLSPRTLPRLLALRPGRGLAGPASWEGGHSFAVVSVDYAPDPARPDATEPQGFRLNWGQGKRHGTNLSMIPVDGLPRAQITDERLERTWQATCSPDELFELLERWDGRTYDAAPSNNRNCHHFVQDLIHRCTHDRGYGSGDR
mmetsp:Transcript_14698/g.46230  ORF Transcript_14698/g.46230 Transcript_14698/m.46230 type:complete len:233 (+) Transcript_14698:68-766(+)